MAYPILARRAQCAAGDGATLGRPKWLRGGCLDLPLSLGSACLEVNRTLRKKFGLVGADMIAYMSRHGVMQTPRQTADCPSSAPLAPRGAHSWMRAVFPFPHRRFTTGSAPPPRRLSSMCAVPPHSRPTTAC